MTDPGRIRRAVVLGAFALSGAASLSYEVVWTRALSVVLGSTTYALSSMLATFMLGLALGGLVGGRIADSAANPLRWFALCELGIGVGGLASHALIGLLPPFYLAVYRQLHLAPTAFFATQIAICSLVMLGPTILMGMTFPLVTRSLVADLTRVGSVVGSAYGINTLGSVLGSMLAGFVLVPSVGLLGTTLGAAALNVLTGVAVIVAGRARPALVHAAAALLYVAAGAAALEAPREPPFIGFHTAYRHLRGDSYEVLLERERAVNRLVFAREGVDGSVAAYRTPDGHLTLRVGGKLEGTALSDVPNTLLLAHLPVAAHPDPRTMLVVGLGAGVTVDAARKLVPQVEVAEISEGVIEAVRRFGPKDVLAGVPIHRNDARNHLFRTERGYDVISSEPSYPTDLGVGNLFSVEYYAVAASRLNDGGIYCQWLPYYMLTNDDVTMMIKTFATVFPFTTLWKVPGSMDLILLGSRTPFVRSPDEVLRRVAVQHRGSPLPFVLSRGVQEVADIARRPDVPVNTDDRPLLEFRVARNFRVGDLGLIER
jgi:spermidine synthase